MDTSIKRYPAKEHHQPVERICRTLELRDDPQLIAEYRRRHSQGVIWPEIPAGIREAGILEMEIYLLDTRLFMIVEVPVGFDWDAAMERLASLPRHDEEGRRGRERERHKGAGQRGHTAGERED